MQVAPVDLLPQSAPARAAPQPCDDDDAIDVFLALYRERGDEYAGHAREWRASGTAHVSDQPESARARRRRARAAALDFYNETVTDTAGLAQLRARRGAEAAALRRLARLGVFEPVDAE